MDSSQPPGAGNSSEKSGMPAEAPPPYHTSFPSQPVPLEPYLGPFGITAQPAVFVPAAPLANPVPDYLVYSIFITVCCCLPLGIAALIFSCSTRNANFLGQRELAEKNSKTARTLNHIGLGIGTVVTVVVVISQIVFWTRFKM